MRMIRPPRTPARRAHPPGPRSKPRRPPSDAERPPPWRCRSGLPPARPAGSGASPRGVRPDRPRDPADCDPAAVPSRAGRAARSGVPPILQSVLVPSMRRADTPAVASEEPALGLVVRGLRLFQLRVHAGRARARLRGGERGWRRSCGHRPHELDPGLRNGPPDPACCPRRRSRRRPGGSCAGVPAAPAGRALGPALPKESCCTGGNLAV